MTPTPAHTSTLYATELRLRRLVLAAHATSVVLAILTLALTRCSVTSLVALVPALSNQLYLQNHQGRTTVGMAPLSLATVGLACLAALIHLPLPTPSRLLCAATVNATAGVTILFAIWFLRIRSCYRRHPLLAPDAALIVLGGAIRDGRPCTTLARRLDVTARLWHESPDRTIVPTGGPVPDASTTEAEAMATYLQQCGVSPERILVEPTALNTHQNIKRACELLDAHGILAQRCVISSDYHLWRALREARALGIDLTPVPAPTPLAGKAQQWCREVLTIVFGSQRQEQGIRPSGARPNSSVSRPKP